MKKAALLAALFLMMGAFSVAAALTDDQNFRAGLKYYNSKNYKAAVKQFREYLANKPDPCGYYLTGYALYKLGRLSESEDNFREAFLIDPQFSLEKAGLISKKSGAVSAKEPAPTSEKKAEKPAAKEALQKK